MNKNSKTLQTLLEAGIIEENKLSHLSLVAKQFSVSITPEITKLLSSENPDHPINLQFVPNEKELETQPYQLKDPIGDDIYSPVKGIVHRHSDRCLLKPINTCPVYCRFCFRRENVGHQEKMLTKEELDQAFEYIASKPDIWEVILTGGDPFMLNPKRMAAIMHRLMAIDTVEVVRIHTRIPVVDPKRINTEMLQALNSEKALFIVLHANHPNEFSEQAILAIRSIIRSGIPMLSQSVLLKGVNDNPETLSALMKTFVKHRIKPYYLHHCDLAKGTEHFRTSIETGQSMMKTLRRDVSGLCQPNYVLDIPGGHGKVPLSLNAIQKKEKEGYILEDFLGNQHFYTQSISSCD